MNMHKGPYKELQVFFLLFIPLKKGRFCSILHWCKTGRVHGLTPTQHAVTLPLLQLQHLLDSVPPPPPLAFADCPCPRVRGSTIWPNPSSWGQVRGSIGLQCSGGSRGGQACGAEVWVHKHTVKSGVEEFSYSKWPRGPMSHPGAAHGCASPTGVAHRMFSSEPHRQPWLRG